MYGCKRDLMWLFCPVVRRHAFVLRRSLIRSLIWCRSISFAAFTVCKHCLWVLMMCYCSALFSQERRRVTLYCSQFQNHFKMFPPTASDLRCAFFASMRVRYWPLVSPAAPDPDLRKSIVTFIGQKNSSSVHFSSF